MREPLVPKVQKSHNASFYIISTICVTLLGAFLWITKPAFVQIIRSQLLIPETPIAVNVVPTDFSKGGTVPIVKGDAVDGTKEYGNNLCKWPCCQSMKTGDQMIDGKPYTCTADFLRDGCKGCVAKTPATTTTPATTQPAAPTQPAATQPAAPTQPSPSQPAAPTQPAAPEQPAAPPPAAPPPPSKECGGGGGDDPPGMPRVGLSGDATKDKKDKKFDIEINPCYALRLKRAMERETAYFDEVNKRGEEADQQMTEALKSRTSRMQEASSSLASQLGAAEETDPNPSESSDQSPSQDADSPSDSSPPERQSKSHRRTNIRHRRDKQSIEEHKSTKLKSHVHSDGAVWGIQAYTSNARLM